MNQLGGYLLERHLHSAPSAVCWQSTEISTGLSALLFICAPALARQAQPAPRHPALLDSEAWATADTPEGPVAYAAAALPAGNAPLTQPTPQQVQQVLEGLQALHTAGGTHGGIAPELLWQVSGVAKLAGAGVPWQTETTPDTAEDLRALAKALQELNADVSAQWLAWLAAAPTGTLAADAKQKLAALTGSLPTSPPPSSQPAAPTKQPATPTPPQKAPAKTVAKAASKKTATVSAPATVPTLPKAQAGAWQQPEVTKAAGGPHTSRQARRLSPWPWLVTALALGVVLYGSYWAYENLQVPQAPTAQTECCQVRYVVRGAAGVPVRVQVLNWPTALNLDPAEAETQVPGEMQLPGPGLYQVRVFADGYTPQTIEVDVPRTLPVTIELED